MEGGSEGGPQVRTVQTLVSEHSTSSWSGYASCQCWGHWKWNGVTVMEEEALQGLPRVGACPLSGRDLHYGAGLDIWGPCQVSQYSALTSAFFLRSGPHTPRDQKRGVGQGHRPHAGPFLMPTETSLERF